MNIILILSLPTSVAKVFESSQQEPTASIPRTTLRTTVDCALTDMPVSSGRLAKGRPASSPLYCAADALISIASSRTTAPAICTGLLGGTLAVSPQQHIMGRAKVITSRQRRRLCLANYTASLHSVTLMGDSNHHCRCTSASYTAGCCWSGGLQQRVGVPRRLPLDPTPHCRG